MLVKRIWFHAFNQCRNKIFKADFGATTANWRFVRKADTRGTLLRKPEQKLAPQLASLTHPTARCSHRRNTDAIQTRYRRAKFDGFHC